MHHDYYNFIFNFSKKPQDARWAELRAAISPHLVNLISEKVIEWACEKPLAPLVIETVRSAIGDVTPIYSKLINEGLMRLLCISDTDHGINDSNQMITDSDQHHLISDPCGHWVLKKLLAVHREGKEEMVFHFNFNLSLPLILCSSIFLLPSLFHQILLHYSVI